MRNGNHRPRSLGGENKEAELSYAIQSLRELEFRLSKIVTGRPHVLQAILAIREAKNKISKMLGINEP